jgi:uncharacterized membrane protein (DUF106 family)
MAIENNTQQSENTTELNKWLMSNKNGILTSIIGTLLWVILFEKIFPILARVTIALSNSFYISYIDNIYLQVANSEPNLGYSALIMLFPIIFFIYSNFFVSKLIKDKEDSYEKHRKEKIEHFKNISPEELKKEIEALEKKVQESRKSQNRLFKVISLLFVIITFLLLLFTIAYYISIKTKSTFEQRINIISPYISDQQRKIIISHYSLMHNERDFKNVMQEIDSFANKNKIKLPENPLY